VKKYKKKVFFWDLLVSNCNLESNLKLYGRLYFLRLNKCKVLLNYFKMHLYSWSWKG